MFNETPLNQMYFKWRDLKKGEKIFLMFYINWSENSDINAHYFINSKDTYIRLGGWYDIPIIERP